MSRAGRCLDRFHRRSIANRVVSMHGGHLWGDGLREVGRAELRGEVLAVCDRSEGSRGIAVRFHVFGSWVRRIKQLCHEADQVTSKTVSSRQPKWRAWADWLVAKINARPDLRNGSCQPN